MSEQHFWMIYFILLLPRLKDDDYMLLSTLEIVQIHEVLLQKLRNKNNTSMELTEDTNGNTSLSEKGSEVNSTEEANKTTKSETLEDDVSFSDLEDEDNDLSSRLSSIRQRESSRVSSASEASDWIHLNERKANQSRHYSESEESNDWQAVGDVDLLS
ncbi:unnamed protein product [Lactuca saligna]|uniref:BSD domain-containing protein n=1 Tax=Lactuca saligna TaxID=75948 RepID=A0AA36EAQ4_LACSI|nr:unnamed protein product [Lactuca saligna]